HCTEQYEAKNDAQGVGAMSAIYYNVLVSPPADLKQKAGFIGSGFGAAVGILQLPDGSVDSNCNLYTVKMGTSEQIQKPDPLQGQQQNSFDAVLGFTQNEDYITRDLTDEVYSNRQNIYGIYADEDGLFSRLDYAYIKNILNMDGSNHFAEITG